MANFPAKLSCMIFELVFFFSFPRSFRAAVSCGGHRWASLVFSLSGTGSCHSLKCGVTQPVSVNAICVFHIPPISEIFDKRKLKSQIQKLFGFTHRLSKKRNEKMEPMIKCNLLNSFEDLLNIRRIQRIKVVSM